MKMTPLRMAAFQFAASAGYTGYEVRLAESKRGSAYDVFVRMPGAVRGKKIGAILLRMVYP
jgi:hypothetical protein